MSLVAGCARRKACEARRDACMYEKQSLEQDLDLLRQYRDNDTVVDNRTGVTGQEFRAR